MARNVATSTTVSLPDLLDFVRPRHRMLLATARGDGNAERDPQTSVLVLSDDWDGTPTRWGPIATGGFPADVAARLDAQ
jgi:hypothetical protein